MASKGRPSKIPPTSDFIDIIHSLNGDISELAGYYSVHPDTIQRWIKQAGVAGEVVSARTPLTAKAVGVVRRRIIEDDHLGAATFWIERTDKLRAQAMEEGTPTDYKTERDKTLKAMAELNTEDKE